MGFVDWNGLEVRALLKCVLLCWDWWVCLVLMFDVVAGLAVVGVAVGGICFGYWWMWFVG